jgi:hypothetical protein
MKQKGKMIHWKVIGYCEVFAILVFIFNTAQSQDNIPSFDKTVYDYLDPKNVPPQPVKESMYFIEDLKAPLWNRQSWGASHASGQEVDISGGVNITTTFRDPQNRLEAAYTDLKDFLTTGNVSVNNENYNIETADTAGLKDEAFKLEVGRQSCRILASGVNGIRRGIFYIEDEMLKRRGAFLTLGNTEHFPAIKRRIIRGYFSPTKRRGSLPRTGDSQPLVIDELMNDIDYYPPEYLNRLAHEGVNGLWLSVSGNNDEGKMVGFGDLVSTGTTPGEGINGQRRLSKLRLVVERCLHYGIRIYLFTIEPCVRIEQGNPILKKYSESEVIGDKIVRNLCGGSKAGQQYLYEATNKIFKAVPELGGIINISHGERYTTCLSSLSATGEGQITCPRCSKIPSWQILYQSLSAMEKGMHDAAPNAELISWLYMPQPQSQSTTSVDTLASWVYDLPAHTPKGVILQFNFTSGVEKITFGKKLVGGDYWLAPAGPSVRFERIANIARENGTLTSSKIQTGTSHEITTVPYVPVPSFLYKKFAAMRRLGVSHTMLSWYFGNAPGLMVKATDLLSFDQLPTEEIFLQQLASIYWKETDVPNVVKAWRYFEEAYENYPLTNLFQYYGPMHDGPVWPLLLKPRDAPLSPTWLLGSSQTTLPWPPSGDRVGDSFTSLLTLDEVVTLCNKMSTSWDSGVAILNRLEPDYSNEPDRILDIGVAKAIGIQFRSGYNILRFYLLREKMLRMRGIERLDILKALKEMLYQELESDDELLLLSRRDSRLGYHPEAEGYKYYPSKIRWRMEQLQKVLSTDFPEVEKQIRDGKLLFSEYTGENPVGLVATSILSRQNAPTGGISDFKIPPGLNWQSFNNGGDSKRFQWASIYDKNRLCIIVKESEGKSDISSLLSDLTIRIQPRRLWPSKRFQFKMKTSDPKKNVKIISSKGTSWVLVQIPWNDIGADRDTSRIRVDVQVNEKSGGVIGWCELKPATPRLEHGTDNPDDFGWLILGKRN